MSHMILTKHAHVNNIFSKHIIAHTSVLLHTVLHAIEQLLGFIF